MVKEKRVRKYINPICYDCLDLMSKGLLRKGSVAKILHQERELCEAHFQERIGGPKFTRRTRVISSRRPSNKGKQINGVRKVGKGYKFI